MREKIHEILNDFDATAGNKTYADEQVAYKETERRLLALYETPVKEFHESFRHPIASSPTIPDEATRILRVKLLFEEVLEFARASGVRIVVCRDEEPDVWVTDVDTVVEFEREFGESPDIVEAADALGDIRYVTDGANLVWGFPQQEILEEIHSSNMTKLGEDGKPIYREDGKVTKGPNYRKPDIAKILKRHGWEK